MLECWPPQYKSDMGILERVQQRAVKITKGLEHLSCEEKLGELEQFILEKRRLREDLINVLLKRKYKEDRIRLSSFTPSARTRNKLKYRKFNLNMRKNLLLERWNYFPREVIGSPSLEIDT